MLKKLFKLCKFVKPTKGHGRFVTNPNFKQIFETHEQPLLDMNKCYYFIYKGYNKPAEISWATVEGYKYTFTIEKSGNIKSKFEYIPSINDNYSYYINDAYQNKYFLNKLEAEQYIDSIKDEFKE